MPSVSGKIIKLKKKKIFKKNFTIMKQPDTGKKEWKKKLLNSLTQSLSPILIFLNSIYFK